MFVRELQTGDKVLLRENVTIEVKGTLRGEEGPEQKPVVYVFDTAGRQWVLHPGDIVQPVHRPLPEGKTEEDMLRVVEEEARRTAGAISDRLGRHMHDHYEEPDEVLPALREAMDAYELGKPGSA